VARAETTLVVLRTERLSPDLVRVHLGGPGLADFQPNGFTDAYVKLAFPGADGEDPVLRTYTVRSYDPEAGELAIDFVVHGDAGVAGPWAREAREGQTLVLRGPGGAYRPDPDADWHLLAGDESALPAIGAALEALGADARGQVFVEVYGSEGEIELPAPEGVEVTWLHRGHAAADAPDDRAGRQAPLVAAVREAPWWDGRVQVFVHREAEAVMKGVRPYIRGERAVPAADASISGYWRRGRTEEGFRVWKRELAAAEAPA